MKPKPQPSGDRHRSGFMLRMPEIFRTKLQLLKDRTGKPMTVLVQWGLKLLLRRFGLWRKEDEKELEVEQQIAFRGLDGQKAT